MSRRLTRQQLTLSCFSCMIFLFSVVVAKADMDNQGVETPSFHGNSFAVYILSRGKGVPEEARTSFNNIHQELVMLERAGELSYLKNELIGLEGERKLCAEFTDSENARIMFTRIQKLASEIDLFNIISESCGR